MAIGDDSLKARFEEKEEDLQRKISDLEHEIGDARASADHELETAKKKIAELEATIAGHRRPAQNASPTASYTDAVAAVVAAARPLLDDYELALEYVAPRRSTGVAHAMKFALDSLDIVIARG
jgi:chromosome segregation ATPase